MLTKGDKAPDFTLVNTQKEKVTLSDHQGDSNVVLLFFPAAFTSVCTSEMCGVRDNMKDYEALDAKVYGISVDMPFTLEKFKKEQDLNFELLSDFNKEASNSYDSIYNEFVLGLKGVSKRAAFVVDKEGTIQYAEVLEDAGKQPDMNKVKSALK